MTKAIATEGPVLVIKQEGDFASLPGIETFVRETKADLKSAREKTAEGTIRAWDIIRRCYEYGERGDVQARVEALNLQPNGNKKVGRPHSGHRLAMEALAAATGISLKWLDKWHGRWAYACKALELAPGCTEKELILRVGKTPAEHADALEKLDAKDEPQDADGDNSAERVDPEQQADKAFAAVVKYAQPKGRLNPAVVHKLIPQLSAWLANFGYVIAKNKTQNWSYR